VNEIKGLILKYLREELSAAERRELELWLTESADNQLVFDELSDPAFVAEALAKMDRMHEDGVWERVVARAAARKEVTQKDHFTRRQRIIFRWTAVAAVISLLGLGIWWLIPARTTTGPVAQTAKSIDIAAPARNRATLTLASGQQVALDSIKSGQLAVQGGARIQKEANGQIAYISTGGQAVELYNTLTNPRGSQVVTLTLSDGTKVWLNAESSIRYPAVFFASDRTVEMTGEGYFEVSKNADKPFKVTVAGREVVDVLGTSFNVNAYDDENAIKTTLLEGSVKVEDVAQVNTNKGKLSVVLKPGEQVQLISPVVGVNTNNDIRVVKDADIEQAVAWKNGLFAFSDADLPTVMRQLSRWYNVDVKYEGEIPKDKYQFNGKIGKTLTLDQVLKILTKTQVHYSIDGNQLTIRP
jgi:transmembrane sensor